VHFGFNYFFACTGLKMIICFSLRGVRLSDLAAGLVRSIAVKAKILTSRAVHAVEGGRGCRREGQRFDVETVAEEVADVLNDEIDGDWIKGARDGGGLTFEVKKVGIFGVMLIFLLVCWVFLLLASISGIEV
jgi:hypothetical protein